MGVSTVKLNGTTLMTVNDTTATASDVAQTKYFYAADGTKTAGTASGGGGAETGVVNYYDYDGTLIATYSDTEFASLASHPANPSHTGLTAQGWNWTLADAKTYVATYKNLDIGQMYVTDDDKTRIYIEIPSDAIGNQLTFYVRYTQSVANGVVVDWGDGNSETFSGTSVANRAHTYASAGQYMITLAVTSGTITFAGSSSNSIFGAQSNYYNRKRIKKIEFGSITQLGANILMYCYDLQSVTMPHGITKLLSSAVSYCYSLPYITIPDTVTQISNGSVLAYDSTMKAVSLPTQAGSLGTNFFAYDYSLKRVVLPTSTTTLSFRAFYYCYSLEEVIIPTTLTSLSYGVFGNCKSLKRVNLPSAATITNGEELFYQCFSLKELTLPSSFTSIGKSMFRELHSLPSISIPNTVTSIGEYAFYNNTFTSITLPSNLATLGTYAFGTNVALKSISIPGTVGTISASSFTTCNSLEEVILHSGTTTIGNSAFSGTAISSIVIPNTVTSIGTSAFVNCNHLKSITLSNTLQTIGDTCFNSCYSLEDITIPDTVTSIGNTCFTNCYSLAGVHMKSSTPPTLGTGNFTNMGSAYTIYVPTGHLSDYQTAENWSAFAARMVEE